MSSLSGYLLLFFTTAAAFSLISYFVLRYLASKQIIAVRQRWLLALTAVNLGIIALHVVGQLLPQSVLAWFFHVRFEYNLNSTFSSLLLLSTGILTFVISVFHFRRSRPQLGLVWLTWSIGYFFLSWDELYMLHERMMNWRLTFTLLGVVLVTSAVYAALVKDRANRSLYLLLIAGLCITAGGGLLLDDALANSFLLEELLELSGATYTLVAAFSYLRRQPVRWQPVYRLMVTGNVLWVVVMIAIIFWPMPTLEAQQAAMAEPTEYSDGALSLLAASVDERVYAPGERIPVTLYWRANRPLPDDYGYSLQLLHPATGEVVVRNDFQLGHPLKPSTNTWPENFVVKTSVELRTEQASIDPANYWLAIHVWRIPWDDNRDDNVLTISRTTYKVPLPDTLLLADLVFSPAETHMLLAPES